MVKNQKNFLKNMKYQDFQHLYYLKKENYLKKKSGKMDENSLKDYIKTKL